MVVFAGESPEWVKVFLRALTGTAVVAANAGGPSGQLSLWGGGIAA
jgi:hypothetical protein